jgi:hypothetical protein
MSQVAPHLTRAGAVEHTGVFAKVATNMTKVGGDSDSEGVTLRIALIQESALPPLAARRLDVTQTHLSHFWQTNTIARASTTMAKCVHAAREHDRNPHRDVIDVASAN